MLHWHGTGTLVRFFVLRQLTIGHFWAIFTCRPKPSLQTRLKKDKWKFMFSYLCSTWRRLGGQLVLLNWMLPSSFSHWNAHSQLEIHRQCWISSLSFCLCMTGAISLRAMLCVICERPERTSYRKEGPSRFPHDGWWQLQLVWFDRIIQASWRTSSAWLTVSVVVCQRHKKVGFKVVFI